MRRPRILVISQIPPPIGGLSVNMQLYLDSDLFDAYELTCVNLSGPHAGHKNPDRPSWGTALDSLAVVARLPGLIRRTRPDLAYLKIGTKWGGLRDMAIVHVCRLFGVPLVAHLHTKPAGTLILENRLLRAVFRRTMRYPKRIIVVTEDLRRRYEGLFDLDKAVVVEAVVDTTAVAPKSGTHGDGSAPPVVLFLGRLTVEKGIFDLLDAARRLLDAGVAARFELAGSTSNPELFDKVRSACEAPPLAGSVVLLGTIGGDEKLAALARADIVVLPTHDDNVPNAVLEAMAAGIPQVASGVGQIPQMIDDGVTGYVVVPRAVGALVDRLGALLEARALRQLMGRAARARALERYDVRVGVEKLRGVFEDVLAETRPS